MKWVAIALALLMLASGVFWLGRNSSPSETPAPLQTVTPAAPAEPAKPAAPETATAPEAPPPATGAMDAAPAPQAQPPMSPPKPQTLAEMDTPTLIRRAIMTGDRCSNGGGNLDQTGQACAERDRIEAILNTRGYCHTSGSADWQRCAP